MNAVSFCNGRYEVIPSNFLAGQSGLPGLARDIQTDAIVFTKSTDLSSIYYNEQFGCLTNEAIALRELAGLGVTPLLDVCREKQFTDKGSQELLCLVMENIVDAEAVSDIFTGIGFVERIEILSQFFTCLANAHSRRITNGDIDLKHLFWRRANLQLVVIDWGNSKNAAQDEHYNLDLIASGKIAYSLLTLHPFPLDSLIALQQLPPDTPAVFQRLIKLSRPKKIGAAIDFGAVIDFSAADLSRAIQEWKTKLVNQLLSQADEELLRGEYDTSLAVYQDVLKWDPRNSRAQVHLIRAKYFDNVRFKVMLLG